jgi:UPF0755 protein
MRLLRLIAIVGIVLLGFGIWFKVALRPVDADSAARAIVDIPNGLSTEQIADLLEEKGVVRSSFAFRLYARWKGLESKLKAGQFVFSSSQGVDDLLAALTEGVVSEVSVTIPEGFTVAQIDALLAEEGLVEAGAFMKCAADCDLSSYAFLPKRAGLAARGGRVEGYLFPDTYFVNPVDFTPEAFLKRMLKTFSSRVVDDLKSDISASDRALHDIVTMASLVEEEAAADDERPVIAGILWKREEAGTSLGVDAAVRYIVNKPSAAITVTDLAVDSPYNLRKYPGLPPGPIANPGIASIRAALHPEESEYWFYLHGSDGTIRYGRTNDEHNENKRKYL